MCAEKNSSWPAICIFQLSSTFSLIRDILTFYSNFRQFKVNFRWLLLTVYCCPLLVTVFLCAKTSFSYHFESFSTFKMNLPSFFLLDHISHCEKSDKFLKHLKIHLKDTKMIVTSAFNCIKGKHTHLLTKRFFSGSQTQ